MRSPSQVQYRNATYLGAFSNYQRNGYGLLVLDSSSFILANFKDNQVHGRFLFITDSLRAYGSMINNRLDGYNIICTTKEDPRALYGMFRDSRLYGKSVLIDAQYVTVSQFVSNQLKETLSKKLIKDRQVYDTLLEHFPRNMYTLEEFLLSFMKQAAAEVAEGEQISRFQPVVTQYGDHKFYGYEECNNSGRRYGFIMLQNELISIGEHLNHSLQGIGRLYQDEDVKDGIFKEGVLRGIGVHYVKQSNKYTLGEHDGKVVLEKGFGFPHRQIQQIRKQFHLRSIYFYNDIVMLGLNSQLNNLIVNVFLELGKTRSNEAQGPRGMPNSNLSNKSPLQTKLQKYEMETDLIEDSSPIKAKMINQYKPVDQKARKYFTLEKDQEAELERQPSRQKVGNRKSKVEERARDDPVPVQRLSKPITTQSRFTYPQNVDSRQEDEYRQRQNYVGPRERSGTKQSKISAVKDTREFVKQLEEEQKRKRLDLDKIYRQAGLYKKK